MTSSALLLADDPMTADLGAYLLRRDHVEVVLANSRQDCLRQLSEGAFDVLLIYTHKFGAEWAEFVRRAREGSQAAIMIVGGEQNDAAALAAYGAGVDDYLSLPTSPAVFLAKVHVWLRRTAPASSGACLGLEAGGLRLDAAQRRLYGPGGPSARLSALETQVLHLLMLHPGQVLPAGYILERVWGCKGKENVMLVKNVIYRLRRKIEVPSGEAACIETADNGYVFQVSGSYLGMPKETLAQR